MHISLTFSLHWNTHPEVNPDPIMNRSHTFRVALRADYMKLLWVLTGSVDTLLWLVWLINPRYAKDGAAHCILGRSTCWPQIYRVCMGIWREIISLENKFWTIYEQQSLNTRQKIVLTKFEGCSCAGKRSVAFFLFSIHLSIIFSRQKVKNATERFLVLLHPSNLANTLFCLVCLLCYSCIVQNSILKKLFAIRFPYEHCKFKADMLSTQNAARGAIFLRIDLGYTKLNRKLL